MGTTNILDINNRIDDLAKSYPADKVMMSDGVTSVEDALDKATTITNQISDNFIFAKVGHVVMVIMSNGTVATDSEGYVLSNGNRFIIPAECRPLATVNIIESYAKKRVQFSSEGPITLPNDLSATGLIIRFEAVYLAN